MADDALAETALSVLKELQDNALLPMLNYLAIGIPFALFEWRFPANDVAVRRRLLRDLVACAVVFAHAIGTTYVAYHGVIRPLTLGLRFMWMSEIPMWLRVAVAPFAIDLTLYWLHRALHTRWLWPLHRWHHSVTELYWLSGGRTSFPQYVLYLLVPLVWAISLHLPGWVVALGALWAVLVNNFMHWNVRWRLRWLERFVITPRVHRLHHRKYGAPGNFGAFLAWDRLFGSWEDPDAIEPPTDFGIEERLNPVRLWWGF
jgi:sterol desaturase/sphingolipid hydroxylase (fatty acid hydroxylase superfamily)